MKHLKIVGLLAILLFAFSHLNAQNLYLNIQGGTNLSTINPLSTQKRIGIYVGSSVEYRVTSRFRASVGVFYSEKGSKNEITFYDSLTNSYIDYSYQDFKMDYLEIPVLLKYCINKQRFKLIPMLGIVQSFIVKATYQAPEQNQQGEIIEEVSNLLQEEVALFGWKNQAKKYEIAWTVGARFQYNFFRKLDTFLEFRFTKGLNGIIVDQLKHQYFT